MKPRVLACIGLAFTLLLVARLAPSDPGSTGAIAAPDRPRMTIDGVRDTGQFLPDSALLGVVDGKPITVRDFIETFFNSWAPDRPRTDSAGRAEWLNSMVNKEIMARVARAVNREPDFAERATLRAYEERVLSNVLYQRQVADSAMATEAEVAELYERTKSSYHLQHVLCVARSTADTVVAELKAGRLAWKDAVARYSVARNDSGPDGDLGWVNLIPLSADMTFGVIALAPGSISPPVGDSDGWHVMRLIASRPATPMDFSAIRGSLANKCRVRRQAERSGILNARLRQAAGMVYDEPNIVWACRFFRPAKSARDEGGIMNIRLNTTLPVFGAADTGRVLARYEGGQLTLSRFVTSLAQISALARPSVDTPDAFRDQVDGVVLEPHRARLARSLGLDRDPIAVTLMARRLEQIRVEHLYQDSIEARVQTTPQEIRRYYDAHPPDFMTFPKARYAMFLFATRAEADSFATVLKTGADAEALVAAAPPVNGRKAAVIREERDQDHGTYHTVLFEELKPGQSYIDGPDKLGQYAVIHLLSFDPGRLLPYDQARGFAEDQVRGQKAEEMLKQFIQRHRRGVSITLHPELVMRVRLLDPAAATE